jgi:hypothetical protein
VPEDMVKTKYVQRFNVIMGDLHQNDDLRMLDYDGHHILNNFSLKGLGNPIIYEA